MILIMYKLKIYLNKNGYLTRESGYRWGAGVEVKASEIFNSRSPADSQTPCANRGVSSSE